MPHRPQPRSEVATDQAAPSPAGMIRLQWRAALWALAVRIGLLAAGWSAVRALVARSGRWPVPWGCSAADPPSILAAVRSADRFVPGAGGCLVRSLAAQALLLQAGFECRLHLAASRTGPSGLAAHAWIEVPGWSLPGEGPGQHQPIGIVPLGAFRLPSRRSVAGRVAE